MLPKNSVMENSKTVSILNNLLQITNDRLEGFREVDKEMIPNYSNLSAEYDHLVMQSTKMRTELSCLIGEMGGTPDDSPTIAGGLHRTWIDVKNAFTADKDEATLESVLFGENAAIKTYEDALKSGDLSPDGRNLINNQLQDLKTSYKKFDSFEKNSDLE